MNSGVIILFYDLPIKTKEQKSKYQKFCKLIKSMGFVIMQNSVYAKYLDNIVSENSVIHELKIKSKNIEGNVYTLVVTQKQYDSIVEIKGEVPKIDKEKVLII